MLPKPFARVRIIYGNPVSVASGDSGLARGLEETAAALEELGRKVVWRDGAATHTG